MSEINMSEWNLERIQAEQDKHMSFVVSGVIPIVKTEQVERNLTEIDNAIDAYIRKCTEDSDMFYICEIAKLYIESQRPAEWLDVKPTYPYPFKCSNCGHANSHKPRYCSYCGKRMKNGVPKENEEWLA